jgi:hypothetical protein
MISGNDPLGFQRLDHADVGKAARCAATQRKAYFYGNGSRRRGRLVAEQRAAGKQQGSEQGETEAHVNAH